MEDEQLNLDGIFFLIEKINETKYGAIYNAWYDIANHKTNSKIFVSNLLTEDNNSKRREVLVKVFKNSDIDINKQNYNNEKDKLGKLNHNNINNVIALNISGLFSGKNYSNYYPYIVHEKVDYSIMDFLLEDENLSEKIVRYFFKQILSSLEYIHSKKIEHNYLIFADLIFDPNCATIKIPDPYIANFKENCSLINFKQNFDEFKLACFAPEYLIKDYNLKVKDRQEKIINIKNKINTLEPTNNTNSCKKAIYNIHSKSFSLCNSKDFTCLMQNFSFKPKYNSDIPIKHDCSTDNSNSKNKEFFGAGDVYSLGIIAFYLASKFPFCNLRQKNYFHPRIKLSNNINPFKSNSSNGKVCNQESQLVECEYLLDNDIILDYTNCWESVILKNVKTNFSQSFKILISKMIEFDVENRIKLEDIRKTKWFNEPDLSKEEAIKYCLDRINQIKLKKQDQLEILRKWEANMNNNEQSIYRSLQQKNIQSIDVKDVFCYKILNNNISILIQVLINPPNNILSSFNENKITFLMYIQEFLDQDVEEKIYYECNADSDKISCKKEILVKDTDILKEKEEETLFEFDIYFYYHNLSDNSFFINLTCNKYINPHLLYDVKYSLKDYLKKLN